jgi:hypothetical protein
MTDLERLVAIEDIRALQSRYVRYADLKDWQALVGLFLPDAVFIPYDVEGKPLVVMTGRDGIAKRVSDSVGSGTALHHLLAYEIKIEAPTRAHAIWAMEDWIDRSNDKVPTAQFKTMHGCGRYHTAYQKVEGRWFIAGQELHRVKLEFTY